MCLTPAPTKFWDSKEGKAIVYNGKIIEIRQKYGKTQTEVANYLGIKQQQYSKYERGINEIPIRYVMKLCEYYNESADEILGLEGRQCSMVYNGNIVKIRKKHNKTQAEVSKFLEIPQQQYSRYEKGINEIPLRYIIKLCQYYNETADEIIGLSPKTHTVDFKAKEE